MSKNMNYDQIAELELLRQEAGGTLRPEQIVEFARSSNTALHAAFTWDDSAAAERWRLSQARQVIRAAVTMLPLPDGSLVPVRAYVFTAPAGTYVLTADVLLDDDATATLLRQMRLDVERAIARYRRHASLAPHIAAALTALDQP